MVPSITTERLLRESAPVAVVLLFWGVIAAVVPEPPFAVGANVAGFVMALLYVGARGVALARTVPATPTPTAVVDLLEENLRVAIPAGAWFLAAVVVTFVDPLWHLVGLPGLFTSPVDVLVYALSGTGVATVVLYAIAVGLPRVRGGVDPDEPEGSETAQTAD